MRLPAPAMRPRLGLLDEPCLGRQLREHDHGCLAQIDTHATGSDRDERKPMVFGVVEALAPFEPVPAVRGPVDANHLRTVLLPGGEKASGFRCLLTGATTPFHAEVHEATDSAPMCVRLACRQAASQRWVHA